MSLKVDDIFFNDVYVFTPTIYSDKRGSFFESWNKNTFNNLIGQDYDFVQDNHSISSYGTIRGLHYQIPNPQGKLVRVISGEIFDVAIDIRKSSRTFGKWCGVILSSENAKQIWIPPGFAHGFLVLSSNAEVIYKTTDYWHKESEKTIIWDDKHISIQWPKTKKIIVSDKDKKGKTLINSPHFE
jgi:dTDP-4-dehydrorhamnose 3,5-epimerase